MSNQMINLKDTKQKLKTLMLRDHDHQMSKIKAIASFRCNNLKNGGCLQLSTTLEESMACIHPVRVMIDGMSKQEKNLYLRDFVRHCIKIDAKKKYAKCEWKIGESPGIVISGVCRECFGHVYGIGKSKVIQLVREIKTHVRAPQAIRFGQKSKPPAAHELSNIQNHLRAMIGHTLTSYQTMSMFCPDTHISQATCTWMHRYFGLIGDYQPTKEEIHLEPITKREVNSNSRTVIYFKTIVFNLSHVFVF